MNLGRRTILYGALTAILMRSLVACGSVVDIHGIIPDDDLVAQLRPDITGKAQVQVLFGSPSTVATFNENVWLYIGSRIQRHPILEAEEIERHVLAVHFNDRGRVSEVIRLTLADGREVDRVERVTPTAGEDITVLEQLLGNVGRIRGRNPDEF